jgi:agmatine/peptidylarginine deiminase
MQQLILFSTLLIMGSAMLAQQQPLPKSMTAAEETLMPAYLASVIRTDGSRTPNAPFKPRAMAEWEELQGITISWSNSFWEIQAEIVRHAREETTVYINTSNEAQVKLRLDQVGVDYTSNVEFIDASYNSLWIRDYGPNTVYINEVDSLVIVDWIYNRPRPLDDQIPQTIGSYLNIPVIETASQPFDLVHTGGNFMSNGNGQGFSSNLVLDENGPNNNWGISNHSEAEVNQIMNDFMGIDEYIKMTNLPFDAIHHIDMHMKMIDEETIILGQYPDGIADGPQIEANLQYVVENFMTTFERPFKIIRIPMPPDENGRYPNQNGDYRTYANAMFVNKTVLLPVYDEQYDTTAIRIWQDALPGHTITGIDCNDIIPLSGALHCIIKEIGVSDPIWILHKPIVNPQFDVSSDWDVNAVIKHKHPIAEAHVYYSFDGGITYDSISMTQMDSLWTAQLPFYPDEVIYYIKATSINGKSVEKPLTGSLGGGWRFEDDLIGAQKSPTTLFEVKDVYPNPASALTAIPISIKSSADLIVRLVDMTGKHIATFYHDTYHNYQRHVFFNANQYNPGMYLIQIQSGTEMKSQQLIIK